MNVLTIFEQRIGAIFAEHAPDEKKPLSFKRLAKRAVREMEDETFVIDGIDTAPALYTVLVAAQDDVVMRPMYVLICEEIAQLIEAQAKKRGYTFVGKPLVRFMVDPALRHGKFSVFAENIDPRTLARLRDEENAYLGIETAFEPYMEEVFVTEPEPAAVPENDGALLDVDEPSLADLPSDSPAAEEQGEVAPGEGVAQDEDEDEAVAASAEQAEAEALDDLSYEAALEREVDAILAADSLVRAEEPQAAFEPAPAVEPEPAAIPQVPAIEPEPAPAAPVVPPFIPEVPGSTSSIPKIDEPAPAAEAANPSCTLTDLASGKEYRLTEAHVIAGRERTVGGLVLTDPNVSRRHAEFTYEGGVWHVRDLNSTNGTLVNNIDVPSAVLRDNDVVTLGITDLQFRAG